MLEITAIIVAGMAGFVLGKSFLFPGTKKRIEAFREGAKDGVKVMIGIVPVFVIAAFFEGLITRLYNDASWLTSFITAASKKLRLGAWLTKRVMDLFSVALGFGRLDAIFWQDEMNTAMSNITPMALQEKSSCFIVNAF